jgi:(p)ppGpp synthase/HD superfamily hydrolase
VQTWFGPGVRSIVEGETRFSKIGNYKEASPEEPIDLKALDLQQLFLAMTEEVSSCVLCLSRDTISAQGAVSMDHASAEYFAVQMS